MRIEKNALEWTVFVLGLAVVLSLGGFLGYAAATQKQGPPQLKVSLETPERIGEGYRTRVRVENVGEETAVAPKFKVDDADLDLDYVPAHSERSAYAFTEKPPKSARAVSAQAP